jgi:fibronectin type 3 domain-containing protein
VQFQLERLEDRIVPTAQLNFTGPLPGWLVAPQATGNASTDTANLQNLLNQVGTAGNSPVLYLPAGNYVINNTLNFDHKIGVSILGAGPGQTTIEWAGASGGTMVNEEGVAYSRFDRVTFDGNNGLAGTALINWWDGNNGPVGTNDYASTGNEYDDDIFQNVGIGLQFGLNNQGQPSEIEVQRDQFIHCTNVGVLLDDWDAIDEWIRDSYFYQCGYGVADSRAVDDFRGGSGGEFNVYNNVFQGSTLADIAGGVGSISIRNNYSSGSNQFYANADAEDIVIQDNTILDTATTPIYSLYEGHLELIDNTIRNSAGYTGYDVYMNGGGYPDQDLVAVGNKFGVASSAVSSYQPYFLADTPPNGASARLLEANDPTIVDRSTVNPTSPPPIWLDTPSVPSNQQVFAAASFDSAGIQNAINKAVAAVNAGTAVNPVVYLPAGTYNLSTTVVIPGNVDMQLIGDGPQSGTTLNWVGAAGGTVLDLQGPSRANLQNFKITGNSFGNGILVENADQPGSRVFMDQPFLANGSGNLNSTTTGLKVDQLNNTLVELRNSSISGNGLGVNVVGGSAPNTARVDLFGGGFGNNTNGARAFDVSNGGRLLTEDIDNEGTSNQFFNLTGSGTVTVQGGRIKLQSVDDNIANGGVKTNSNDQPIDPNNPPLNINGFSGNVSLLGLETDVAPIVQSNTPAATNVLLLDSDVYDRASGNTVATSLVNNSSASTAQWLDEMFDAPTGGVQPLPGQQSGAAQTNANTFLLNMLNQVRTEQPEQDPLTPEPAGVTDVGIYRVLVSPQANNAVGIHITGTSSSTPAPTGLTATAGNAQVALQWNASSGAASYNVYRSTASGQETLYKSGITATSFTDTGATNGTKYYYEITAVSPGGVESAQSSEVSATPTTGAPSTPTGLTATAGNAQVALRWNASSGATSYNVYRSTASGQETLYKSGITATSFTDTGATNGTKYYYEITAVSPGGVESAQSSEVSATPAAGAPSAPTGFTASAGNAQVALQWNASSGATSYDIYRSTTSGHETLYKSGITTTSYTDTGVTDGTKYYYKVTAVSAGGQSVKSSEVSATPTPTPTPPTPTPTGTNMVQSVSLGTASQWFPGWLGMEFTTGSSAVSVSQLGRWVVAGNSQSHTLELVDAATGSVLASTTLNMAGQTTGQFAYASLSSPVTLAANHTYYLVSMENSGGDAWYDNDTVVTATNLGITVNSGVYNEFGISGWSLNGVAGSTYGPVSLIGSLIAPELLAGTPIAGSHAPALTQKQLDGVVAEAIQLWASTGLSAAQVSQLQNAQFVITTLPSGMLGETIGNTVYIDATADGYGWFLGSVLSGQVAPNKIDLLTVVSHELGNVLGLPELQGVQQQPGNVMDDTLAPGVRRLEM